MRIEQFKDDPDGVPNDAILYRRVHWDMAGGRAQYTEGEALRLSGNHFSDYPEGSALALGFPAPCMSVGVDAILTDRGYGPEKMLEKHPEMGLVQVTAGDLRSLVKLDGTPCPQGIMLAPTGNEPWHAVVFDCHEQPRSKKVRNQILLKAQWVVPLFNH